MSARPRGTDSARVIQVIETNSIRGMGVNEDDMCRGIYQYWDLNGKLLAENDPVKTKDMIVEWLKGKRYIVSGDTEEYEKEHQYELGSNRMIDKIIKYLNELE